MIGNIFKGFIIKNCDFFIKWQAFFNQNLTEVFNHAFELHILLPSFNDGQVELSSSFRDKIF